MIIKDLFGKSENEKKYTSTDEKLIVGGLERLAEFQKTGMLRPQSLQLAPEDTCQLDCTWCSTKYREHEYTVKPDEPHKVIMGEKKRVPNQISFTDITNVIKDLMAMGPLKTVELTGAGDPSMYKCQKTGMGVSDLIDYLHDRWGLQVGMITNGMGLTRLVRQESLDRLAWLRVSLASFDPQNFHGNNDGHANNTYANKFPNLPDKIQGKLGFSYVWGENSDLKVLERIADYAKNHNVDFVRVVPDCLDAPKQSKYRDDVSKTIAFFNDRIGRDVMFFQAKRYDVHPTCRIGYAKPFLNADGYFYHCSAVPLYNQAFTPHWRMGHLSEVSKIWDAENIGKFDTSKCEFGKCFYAEQNELMDAITKGGPHRDFL